MWKDANSGRENSTCGTWKCVLTRAVNSGIDVNRPRGEFNREQSGQEGPERKVGKRRSQNR